ncbi:MAG TPA: Grx4 family monothiol glutaredoxin [Polyangiaceae bacterium]|nr:Grx4 family monothiol glutaredoxin [Polyangiaceae bacterium]
MALSEALKQRIDGFVASDRVVLFMKGTRRAPQCGFSAQVVQILDELVPEYQTHDVLSSAELRDGIKEYSQWPTIPQLYIDGKFVGGCDIVRDLKSSGELEQLLAQAKGAPPPAPPQVSISAEAVAAIKAAVPEGDPDRLHLQVSASWEHDLYFGPVEAGEVEVDLGSLKLYVPRSSVGRAQGVSIGYIDGPNAGFKIENPNQPAQVIELSVQDAKAMLDRGELQLFDVRPESEGNIARIAAGKTLNDETVDYINGLPKTTPIAFYCHHGMRSRGVAQSVVQEGFRKVYNLKGGIDAWSLAIDSSIPRY